MIIAFLAFVFGSWFFYKKSENNLSFYQSNKKIEVSEILFILCFVCALISFVLIFD